MKKLLLSGIAASAILLLGRISGFLREAYLAKNYGASAEADIIIILLTTPDLLINLLVGGAFSVVLIPAFNELSKFDALRLYREFSFLILLIFTLISLLLIGCVDTLLYLLAPGMVEFSDLEIIAIQLSVLAIPFCALSGVTVAYLHYKERFLVAASGTLIFNSVVILGLVFVGSSGNYLFYISWVLIFASMLRWFSQIVDSGTLPIKLGLGRINQRIVINYFYAVLSGGLLFSVPVILRSIATLEGPGSLSLLNYSMKLVDLPVGVFATIFSVAFLPKLSQRHYDGNNREFSKLLSRLIFMCIVCTSIASVAFYFTADFIVDFVYNWGGMNDVDLKSVVMYFSVFLISIPFQVVNFVLVSALAARKDTLSPLIVISLGVVVFLLYCICLTPSVVGLVFAGLVLFICISFSLMLIVIFRHGILLFSNKIYVIEFLKVMAVVLSTSYLSLNLSHYIDGIYYAILIFFVFSLSLLLIVLSSVELRKFIIQK